MKQLAWMLAFALVGCAEFSGLSDFSVETQGAEGGTSATGGSGGSPASGGGGGGSGGIGGTTPTGPFTLVGPVDAINTANNEDDPTFTADGLELFFNRTTPSEIMRSKRDFIDTPWGAPGAVAELNSPSSDSNPVISADGLTLWLASNRAGGIGGHDIYVATRTAVGQTFTTPVVVAELNSDKDEMPSFVDASGTMMLLMRRTDAMNNGPLSIFRSRRDSTSDPWMAPVSEQQTLADELDPWMSSDGLAVFVRTGNDIGMAERASRMNPFEPVVVLPELDAAIESDPWLMPDTSYIMFTRQSGGDADIWEAYR